MLLRSIAPGLGLLVSAALLASACGDGSCESEALASLRSALVAGAAGESAGGAPSADEGGAGGQPEAGAGGENTGAVPSCTNHPGANPVVYDGSGQSLACTSKLRVPYKGDWYVSDDGTGTQTSDAPNGEHGGVSGASDCAMHSAGSGFSSWGGVTLYLDDFPICPYELSGFAGVRLKLKGSSQSTQGACGPADDVVHLKVGTLATTPESFGGTCVPPSDPNAPGCWDDFGGYCTLSEDWTTCDVWFSELSQRGWGIPAVFKPSEVTTLTFLVEGNDLSWDFWVDDLSFIPGDETSPGKGSGNDCTPDSGGSGGTAAGGSGGGSTGASGGSAGSGGSSITAGSGGTESGTAGSSSAGTAPASNSGGDAPGGAPAGTAGNTPDKSGDSGCSCRLASSAAQSQQGSAWALIGLVLALRARRKSPQLKSRRALPAAVAS